MGHLRDIYRVSTVIMSLISRKLNYFQNPVEAYNHRISFAFLTYLFLVNSTNVFRLKSQNLFDIHRLKFLLEPSLYCID